MIDERDELRAALASLQQQVAALQRRARFGPRLWRGVVLLGFLGLVLFWSRSVLPAQAGGKKQEAKAPADLTCRSLQIVDAEGKPRLELTVDREAGLVRILGSDGKERA